MPEPPQRELFPADPELANGVTIAINAQCQVKTSGGRRVVLVAGMPIAAYVLDDAMAEAHAMVEPAAASEPEHQVRANGRTCGAQ